MGKKNLKVNVSVDGTFYGPDHEQPSADVAKLIDNPDVWEGDEDDGGDGLLEGQEDPSNYDGVSAAVLKKEIARRNKGREKDDKISAAGDRDTLAAALMADDEPRTS